MSGRRADCAHGVDQFQSIALGNFLFKIITKIIADRLDVVCSRIISPNKFDFIRSTQIGDALLELLSASMF